TRSGRRSSSGRRAASSEGRPAMAAGEAPIKQAVKWIDDRLRDDPAADRVKLLDEASRRFDLSPLDTDFLFRHLAERAKRTSATPTPVASRRSSVRAPR